MVGNLPSLISLAPVSWPGRSTYTTTTRFLISSKASWLMNFFNEREIDMRKRNQAPNKDQRLQDGTVRLNPEK